MASLAYHFPKAKLGSRRQRVNDGFTCANPGVGRGASHDACGWHRVGSLARAAVLPPGGAGRDVPPSAAPRSPITRCRFIRYGAAPSAGGGRAPGPAASPARVSLPAGR